MHIVKRKTISSIIKAMGLVFGDIGTSPIYTLTVIFLTLPVSYDNVLGVLSLVIWTLLLVVTAQYAFLAMSLSKRGEGGAIVLNEIFKKLVKSSRAVAFTSLLTYIGISLLTGDSIITPAISILSAVEGIKLIPSFGNITQGAVLVITLIITISLFSIQKRGTEKISKIFGPVMLVWFCALGIFGLIYITSFPDVIAAFNPARGINFILSHGFAGFFILSEVILCATGAEALYADMGHLGRRPITNAWFFVLTALLLNYLGQGVFLLHHPHVKNILFSMILNQSHFVYIPFLILSIFATIIASQAMISGLFSIVYQGINTHILPMFKIKYTSKEINSQIYIGAANAFLMAFVILIILVFKKSENLAAAYGLAVTGTITITAVMISVILFLRKKYYQMALAVFLLFIDICFLIATSSKIPDGAYWSIIIAAIPFALILIYTKGHQMLYRSLHLMDKHEFLEKYNILYANSPKIEGTAVYFTRSIGRIPPYIVKTMFANGIIYQDNIFVRIDKTQGAYGVVSKMSEITKGLRYLQIDAGYMEVISLEKILKKLNIDEKVIFYGVEEIETENFVWKIFAFIKKNAPAFVNFYHLPIQKVHGVITKVEESSRKIRKSGILKYWNFDSDAF